MFRDPADLRAHRPRANVRDNGARSFAFSVSIDAKFGLPQRGGLDAGARSARPATEETPVDFA
jgi:hypothetical protein